MEKDERPILEELINLDRLHLTREVQLDTLKKLKEEDLLKEKQSPSYIIGNLADIRCVGVVTAKDSG